MYRVVVQDLAQYVFGQGKTLCRVAFYDHSFSGCEEGPVARVGLLPGVDFLLHLSLAPKVRSVP